MAGNKGSNQQSQQVPQYIEDASKEAIALSKDIGRIGYVPYRGPDVAALSPQQMAYDQNVNAAAQAYGLGGANTGSYLPPAMSSGGVQGYSGAPIFDQAVRQYEVNDPGSKSRYDRVVTGSRPAYSPNMWGSFGNVFSNFGGWR